MLRIGWNRLPSAPAGPAADVDRCQIHTRGNIVMNRRRLLHTAKVIAASAGAALSAGRLAAAERQPIGAPVMRRFNEQRWALDNIIQANGIDWDQGRTAVMIRNCGAAVIGDMAVLRQRVKKYADIAPAFEALARIREA